MTPCRSLVPAAVVVAGVAVATVAPPADARPAVGAADRCLVRTPIPVRGLPAAARSGCSLVGRLVTDGRVSVVVPPAGMSVRGDGVGRHGDVVGLTVVNTGSTVRAVGRAGAGGGGGWFLVSLPPVTPTTPVTTPISTPITTAVARGSTAACRDRTFHLEHHRWSRSLRYRINLSHLPRRFSRRVVTHQIRRANGNMRLGRNTCGKPYLRTPRAAYLGHTSRRPNIRTTGPTCGTANTANVVGFGNLPGSLLGWTCYWFDATGRMAGADILLDDGPYLATRLPAACASTWDLEGTVTHEWGHAYGLAHAGTGHPNLTMQHELKPCSTYARTLGLGDWLGMSTMYGHR